MIESYTIKFGPAVSQKELEKKLFSEAMRGDDLKKLRRMRARIEIVADPKDVRAYRRVS